MRVCEHCTPGSARSGESVYAPVRHVEDLGDCYFYQSIVLPDLGLQEGEWDLRDSADAYLGHVPLAGKRVLEIGSANGFLCLHMEAQGAEVVAFDLSEEQSWDLVPSFKSELDYEQALAGRRRHVRKINNAWWLAHRLFRSKAKRVYGNAYEIPEAIDMVDGVTLGSVLIHLRDPLRALTRAARFAREALIITEASHVAAWLDDAPIAQFLPSSVLDTPTDTWWRLSPKVISEFVRILGFSEVKITYHLQAGRLGSQVMYTLVARRG